MSRARWSDCWLAGSNPPLDTVHILAWKIGKLCHGECEERKEFVYAKDWRGAEQFEILRYKKPFPVKEFADYVAVNIRDLEGRALSDPQGVLDRLAAVVPDGIDSMTWTAI